MNDFEETRKEKTYIVGMLLRDRFYEMVEIPFKAYSKAHALKKWHDYIENHSGLEWDSDDFEFMYVKEKGK